MVESSVRNANAEGVTWEKQEFFPWHRFRGNEFSVDFRSTKLVVRYEPLVSAVIPEQFRAGHEEHAPAGLPAFPVSAVGGFEDAIDGGGLFVHPLQPRIAGFFVVFAVPQPLIGELQVLLAVEQQVLRGHHAAREEVTSHPVGVIPNFERVGEPVMAEDVYEQQSAGLQPGADVAEQQLVVADVFEHFHRDDSVKRAAGQKIVDIGCDDFQVVQSTACGFSLDVLSL